MGQGLMVSSLSSQTNPPPILILTCIAIIGARLFCPLPNSKSIGWMLNAGPDFPVSVRSWLSHLNITTIIREREDRQTTIGIVSYPDADYQSIPSQFQIVTNSKVRRFRFVTPLRKVTSTDLTSTPLLFAKSLHLMCSPSEAEDMISGLKKSRMDKGINEKPLILWEPQPDSCRSNNLGACLCAAQKVDVFSPNDVELAYLYGLDGDRNDKTLLEELAFKVIDSGVGPENEGLLVLRAGDKGCLIASKKMDPVWVPAFVDSPCSWDLQAKSGLVVDPTGCGNAFLGGFAFGLVKTGNPIEAGVYGNVAARFVFEQIGVPNLSYGPGGSEMWNDTDVQERLAEYIANFKIPNYKTGCIMNICERRVEW